MKYFLSLLIVLPLFPCRSQTGKESIDRTKTHWALYELKGNIKSLYEENTATTIITGKEKEEEYKSTTFYSNESLFNQMGMLLLEKQQTDGRMPIATTKFDGINNTLNREGYNAHNNSLRTEYRRDNHSDLVAIVRQDTGGTFIEHMTMKYSGNKLKEETTYNRENKPISIKKYTYDNSGNPILVSNTTDTKYLDTKDIYKYDAENRKTSEIRYINDTLTYKVNYFYEGKNLTKEELIDGSLSYTSINDYDKKGNLLNSYIYPLNGKKWQRHSSFTYDDNGNMTNRIEETENGIIEQVTCKYDDQNNIILGIVLDREGNVREHITCEYEYDNHGNWTKKSENRKKGNKTELTVQERTITYFPNQ